MSVSLQSYGFEDPDFVQSETYAEFQKAYDTVLQRRYERWKRVINQVKRFCRKGIPSEFRSHVWMTLSGADKEMKENPNVYKSACGLQPAKEFNTTILADLPRTFPENVNFSDAAGAQNKRHSLQRVLQAFAITFPKIGYCQVSAPLLLMYVSVQFVTPLGSICRTVTPKLYFSRALRQVLSTSVRPLLSFMYCLHT
ncbi:unnamed protein product [Dibothriocephalus latus]|uniref:Rab-GAP TBC domain-containing protein n=1 Tax=Dibothriocephalus latus TaxID=60516 RepID=A0A3P7LK30_DIBLA|nr:unnamed protein product [Dibothriocephalus latus]